MTTSATVATVSTVVAQMIQRAAMARTLMGGTEAMRAAGKTYLPKEAAETEDSYKCRTERTFLFNAFGKTVEDMTGKVFDKPVVLKDNVPEQVKTFAENIDRAGRHLNEFARDVFLDGLQPGVGFILVDMPPKVQRADGAPATLADEQAAGIRPYLVYIPLEKLLGWKSQKIGGAEVLTQFRFMECATEAADEFLDKEIEQVRVIEPGKWSTWRKSTVANEADKWVLYEEGVTSITDKVTVVPFYTRRTGFMTGSPPLAKLAELNVAHWQSQSDQKNILHVARVPILFGAGFTEADKIEIGANTMVRSTDANAKLTYVEHTGGAIGSGDKDLANLELQMQAVGSHLLVNAKGPDTATGEIRDDSKENSPLAMMARSLADSIEAAFAFMAEFAGLGKDTGGEVEVNQDFGVQAGRTDLQQLVAARANGDISRETLWSEMQRRDYLSDAFDPEAEKVRLANEPNPLDNVAPGKGMNLDGPPPAK